MIFAGTPAASASARPRVAVVPPTSPLDLSTLPSTGLPVNTARRSAPVGASSDLCAAVGAGGALAQPAASRRTSAARILESLNMKRPPVCLRLERKMQRLLHQSRGDVGEVSGR